MNSTLIDIRELEGNVAKIALDLGREFGEFGVTRDLIYDHAWQWIYDHAAVIEAAGEKYGDQWRKYVAGTLRADCRYASVVLKGRFTGIPHWITFHYTLPAIEQALYSVFREDGWLDAPLPVNSQVAPHARLPAPAGDWVTTLADVSSAVSKLSREDQRFLLRKYGIEMRTSQLSALYEVDDRAIYETQRLILNRVHNLLGGPGPRRMCNSDCTHPRREPGVLYGDPQLGAA